MPPSELIHLGPDDFHARVEANQSLDDIIYRKLIVPKMEIIKAHDGEERISFVISTADEDRDGDTIAQNGWKLDNYLRNPVVMWAHDYRLPPIAKARDVRIENNMLKADAIFVPEDIDGGFSHMIFRMLQERFLNATSVGFKSIRFTRREGEFGLDFLEQELWEYSVVPVPANPNALIEARAKGINTAPMLEWCEKVLDGENETSVTRDFVIRLRKTSQVKEPPKTYKLTKVAQDDLAAKNTASVKIQKLTGEPVSIKDIVTCQETGDVTGTIVLDDGSLLENKLLNRDVEALAMEIQAAKQSILDAAVSKEARTTGKAGDDDHVHGYDDATSGITDPAGEEEHVHAVTLNDDKTITIEASNGHTHEPDPANAAEAEEDLVDEDGAHDDDDDDKGADQPGDIVEEPVEIDDENTDSVDTGDEDKSPSVTECLQLTIRLMAAEIERLAGENEQLNAALPVDDEPKDLPKLPIVVTRSRPKTRPVNLKALDKAVQSAVSGQVTKSINAMTGRLD